MLKQLINYTTWYNTQLVGRGTETSSDLKTTSLCTILQTMSNVTVAQLWNEKLLLLVTCCRRGHFLSSKWTTGKDIPKKEKLCKVLSCKYSCIILHNEAADLITQVVSSNGFNAMWGNHLLDQNYPVFKPREGKHKPYRRFDQNVQ